MKTKAIKMSKEFKAFLHSQGSKGETYEDIILRLAGFTKDKKTWKR